MLTISQFEEYRAFLETRWSRPSKIDYYLAQICQFISASTPGVEPGSLSEYMLEVNQTDDDDDDAKFVRERVESMRLNNAFGQPIASKGKK